MVNTLLLDPLTVPQVTAVGPAEVTAKTVYFCVKFPSGYRYYFVFAQDDDIPILLDHPFRDYYPRTITVLWDTPGGGEGIYLDINAIPGYEPFGDVTARIHIPEGIYNEITAAFGDPLSGPVALGTTPRDDGIEVTTEVNFVASEMLDLFQMLLDVTPTGVAGLEPPVSAETSGVIEFILISTGEGPQYKIDLSHAFPPPPESPITVETLTWQEVLFTTMSVFDYDFYYIVDEDLAMTFIHPVFCFMRQWVGWPTGWTAAIKEFSGTP
jgi:hypothetical protein